MSGPAYTNLIMSVIGIIVWTAWGLKFRKQWRYIFLPMIYLVNVCGLYLFRLFGNLTPDQLNLWSNVIRMYSLLLAILIPLALIHYGGKRWIWM